MSAGWLAPEEFHQRYEPLPESTLDLEAIEGMIEAWGQHTSYNLLSQYIDDLIAEVKRLRRG